MRIKEIALKSIKPIKPLTPAQARIQSLKVGIERGKDALKIERDSQKRKRDTGQRIKQQSQLSNN